jgi:hypothetical protein
MSTLLVDAVYQWVVSITKKFSTDDGAYLGDCLGISFSK